MPAFTFGESKFGIKVPPGWYAVRFEGTEDRDPVSGGKFKSNEPRMAWVFEVIEGEHRGVKIEQESGITASPKSTCARMLIGLFGRQIPVGEKVVSEQFVGRTYRLKVAVNPDSDKGNLHVADIEAMTSQGAPPSAPKPPPRPPKPGTAPEPAWSAKRFWVVRDDAADPVLTDALDVQNYIVGSHLDPKALQVCPEGGDKYAPASEFGFLDAIPF